MRTTVFSLLIACCGMTVVHAQTALPEVTRAADDAAALEEVVITGERAGPRLWQVKSGDHVLWLLGTLEPLPAKMSWQSQQVAAVIAESQAVLMDRISVSADVGLFAKLGLYLQWRRMQKNADKQTLQALLPADLYQRFALLKQRYARTDNDIEKLRPIMAAQQLNRAATKQIGLSYAPVIAKQVNKLARQHDIKPQTISIKVENPGELLTAFKQISPQAEQRCLDATLSRLESDLSFLTARANAWALGDVDELRKLLAADSRTACWDVINSLPRVQELTKRAEDDWLSAAESMLKNHKSSLALRSIRELIAANGALARFRAEGYVVIGP